MAVWDLSGIYDFEKTEETLKKLNTRVEKAKLFRSELKDNIDGKRFMEILKEIESISSVSSKIAGYASLWLSEKTDSSERNTHYARISQILTEMGNELIFFGIWFKNLGSKDAERLISCSGKYSYYLESVRRFRKYSLDEKEERIINIKDLTGDDASSRFYDIITNAFVFDFCGKKVSISELISNVRSPDSRKRELAYTSIMKKYAENEPILGEIYKTLVQSWCNENMKIRGFEKPISPRNLENNLKDETVETMLNVIRKNISVFNEYFRLKAKILGYKKLSRYHIYAPIAKFERRYSYNESRKLVLGTYRNFSEKAYAYAKEIFDLEHVHSEIMPGKQNGAFCTTISKDISPFILQSFNGKMLDLFTMMHEFGHGIHGRAARNQTEFTYHSSTPMAETASIFGETLLEKRMLREVSRKEKKAILIKSMDDKYASIIRQAYIVIFENRIYDEIMKGATIEQINSIYLQNLKEQFGKSVDVPKAFQHEWKYILHLYHYPFYCYSYAFGNLMALAFYRMYEEEGKSFADKYMKMLEAGGSDSTINIVRKNLGVDISKEEFWQKAFDLIKEDLEELKNLV